MSMGHYWKERKKEWRDRKNGQDQALPACWSCLLLSFRCFPIVSSNETVWTSSSPEPFRAWDLTTIRPSGRVRFLHVVGTQIHAKRLETVQRVLTRINALNIYPISHIFVCIVGLHEAAICLKERSWTDCKFLKTKGVCVTEISAESQHSQFSL